MATFQGLVRKTILNTNVQFDRLGTVSSNIANYGTTAFKSVRFEQMLDEHGYLNGVVRTDYSNGAVMRTDQKFDIALKGVGFIPVTSKNGDVTYTRDGSLKLDKDGYLITNDNCLVGDGIKIPANYHDIRIKPNGDVAVIPENGDKEKVLGKIPVVNFTNPEGLKAIDGNKYLATNNSGEPILIKKHNTIQQGAIERSNVNIFNQVNDVMRLNASMLASFKLMKTIDDMYNKSINIKQ